jgi:tRNA1(Val) A37 N6-methylase TrmN6
MNQRPTMPMVDQFFTPGWLAMRMAEALPAEVRAVGDFAAGHGALLRAVADRFGDQVRLLAFDRDPMVVRHLRRVYPQWNVGRIDLFSSRSRASSRLWSDRSLELDAVVLNPPYSYRGGETRQTVVAGEIVRSTPASLFLAVALEKLRPGGTLLAVMPASAMDIQRDSAMWERWRYEHKVEVLDRFSRNTFAGTRASTALIRISKATGLALTVTADPPRRGIPVDRTICTCVELLRGRVPVHRMNEFQSLELASVPFIHTTDLVDGGLLGSGWRAGVRWGTRGPMVLVPRVGRMYPSKVVKYEGLEPLVLSDCVIGLRPIDTTGLQRLADAIGDTYQDLHVLYRGSCAPYVTLQRLLEYLRGLGFVARQTPASSAPEPCRCYGLQSEAVG